MNIYNSSITKWKEKAINEVSKQLTKMGSKYKDALDVVTKQGNKQNSIHLAVFSEPYLAKILSGQKTIESRFTKNKVTPYDQVKSGDVVIMKKSGGEIKGCFIIDSVEYHELKALNQARKLQEKYSDALCFNRTDTFWESKSNSNFATLMFIGQVIPLKNFNVEKRDRRAWVLLRDKATQQTQLWNEVKTG